MYLLRRAIIGGAVYGINTLAIPIGDTAFSMLKKRVRKE